ncbi:MAG: translation initiation factor IF-2, partial [Oscillospiraceae bacterium]|nr:translation initiation factor IF-2 [Oscillospiraceae bacterium]
FTPGGAQGGRPFTPGGQRPFTPGGAARPGGFSAGGAGRPGGFRKPEIAPAVEKERVSNYDPNKKQYIRQHDPEHIAKNRKQLARDAGMDMHDDDVVRGKRGKKRVSAQQMMEPIRIDKAFMTAETITVKDLSERIGKTAAEIMKKLLLLGTMATINQELDFDTASLVCTEFGVELEKKLDKTAEDILSDENFNDTEENLVPRPPVVTIMGHVDHGKTTLLDYIRKSRVAQGEAGGITQHIGAYQVDVNNRKVTFLDTPGHEAFTAMRARGATATDIVILVVAADDGVMPQTVEALNHARAAKVPIIVAITKIDKHNANIDRVKQDLVNRGVLPEEWGGDTIMTPVSAVTGENVDTLLEMILLVADMQQLRANPNRRARGVIIEAKLDRGRGPVATALVQNGTLHVGDMVVAGTAYGRIRAMLDAQGKRVDEAGPSTPVEIIGFGDVPDAGDDVMAVEDDRLSRQVAEERKTKARAAMVKSPGSKVSLDDLYTQISEGQMKDLNLIVKADVQGSVEAVTQSLERLSMDEVRVRVIHGGAGAITENDVMLASTASAIIIGFNVRPDNGAADLAKREDIDVRLYRVIYDAINDVEKAMKGLLAPEFKETVLGRAQVRQVFKVTGVGTIAGCYVVDGKILRSGMVRLTRDHIVVFEGKIASLKHLKDDAREIAQGFECGIGIERYNDVKVGDEIECYIKEEIAR